MKRFRRVMAIVLWLLLGGAALVSLALVLFLARPEAFLPKNSMSLAASAARLAGIYLTYPKEAVLTIQSISFRDKRLTVDAPSLCYDGVDPHISGCFGAFHAEAEIRLAAFPPKILKLGPVEAKEGRFRVQLEAGGSDAPPADEGSPSGLPKDIALGPVSVDFKSLRIEAPNWELVTAAHLHTSPTYEVVASGRFTQEGKPKPFSLNLRGEGDQRSARGKLDGWVENPIQEIKRVAFDTCGFDLKAILTENMQWNLLCPTELTPAKNVIPAEWREGWDGKVRLLVRAEGGTEGSRDPKGNVEVDLMPFKTAVVHGRGKIQFHLEDVIKEKLAASVEAEVHVVDFQRAVKNIKDKSYAVPSPLNAMKGELALSTNGKAEIDLASGRIPFTLETKLGSPAQNFHTRAEGALGFRREKKNTEIDLAADIALTNVELVLPPLEPTKLPMLFPDPRIRFPEREIAASESNFHYRLRIHSPPGSPVRLISNLAKGPVPVNLSLNLSSESPATGTLSVASFPVEILRRKATVRYFKIELSENAKAPPIRGEVDVRYAEYELTVRINGTTEQPHLSIESDPPLTEEDAYSVLVFGRPLTELSPSDGDTVANLRAAVSNRAVGLASMYLLATTPIESVTYDPTANVFNARIRIADGTSLNVGSDWRSVTQLGVKRKLSPSWILNTFIDNPFGGTTQQQRSVSSFLEWSKRY